MAPSLIQHDAELCRQGVNDLLSKFKTIETNLRNHGHHTNFSEDGISYMQGRAETNEGGLRSIAAWVHFFEKRMKDDGAPKVKAAHQDKPPARVLPQPQTITPPPEWSEDNISRHATDDHWPDSTPVERLCHQHQDQSPVYEDTTHLLEQVQQQQARIVELEQDLRNVEEKEEQNRQLQSHQQAIIVHWERQLLAAKTQYQHLQGQQQARIEELEEKLRVCEDGKRTAVEQVQQLQEQKSVTGGLIRAGPPNTEDLADQILHLLALHRAIVCKQDEHTQSIRQLTSGLYKLSLTHNDSMRRAQNDIAKLTDSSFLGRVEMAQVKQLVDIHNSNWLPSLNTRVSAAEANIGALDAWAQSWYTG